MRDDKKNGNTEPRLDRPGAGLPVIERMIAGRLIAARYRRMRRDEISAEFESERVLINAAAERVEPTDGATRILVDRQRGMEDSSRFWSIYMVLEHLCIVNEAVAGFIGLLGSEKTPEVHADTAKVKPSAGVGREVIDRFNRSCEELLATVNSIENLQTRATHPHPWFGPFDAAQWHHMAAFHMTLHRKQIEAIQKKLD